jgi:hypothetical protein
MAVECPPGAIGFMFRIKMQHHSRDFAPVSTFRIGILMTRSGEVRFALINGPR